jgi:RNA polymerase sigma factor (sigma-70 family)
VIVQLSDHEIVSAIKRGEDSVVFKTLYDSAFPKVHRYIRKSGGQLEDAQDAFQDAVMTFYRQVVKGDYVLKTEIDGYLYTVAKNNWLGKLRREKGRFNKDGIVPEVESDESTIEPLQTKERDSLVSKAFASVGERCKELLTKTIYEGLSLKEVVNQLGFSTIDAAKTKNYKCKQRLIQKIKDNKELKEYLISVK